MNENKKLVAITTGTYTGRLLMGVGCGMFVRMVRLRLAKDAKLSTKIGIWAASACTAWALGRAVDCYWDKVYKILVETANFTDTIKKDLSDVCE